MTATKQPKPLPPLAKEAAADSPQVPPAGAKRDRTMFQQHSDFVTHWHRVLPGGNVLTVWHYLWSIAHRNGEFMFVGADKIAVRTGVHERTVRRCVKALAKQGVLELQQSEKYGRGTALGYRIPQRLPQPPAHG